jgi:hypothetical protein
MSMAVDFFDVFHTCVMSLLAFLLIHLICHHGDGSIAIKVVFYMEIVSTTNLRSLYGQALLIILRLVHNRLLSPQACIWYLNFEPPLNKRKQSISTRFGQQVNFSYGSHHWEQLWHYNGDGDAEFSQGEKRK